MRKLERPKKIREIGTVLHFCVYVWMGWFVDVATLVQCSATFFTITSRIPAVVLLESQTKTDDFYFHLT